MITESFFVEDHETKIKRLESELAEAEKKNAKLTQMLDWCVDNGVMVYPDESDEGWHFVSVVPCGVIDVERKTHWGYEDVTDVIKCLMEER